MLADTEVLVVGGGPAGLATAVELRQRGLEVVVIDRASPPIDKACGEGLMPDGVRHLVQLGVHLPTRHRAELRGIRYLDGEIQAQARFLQGTGLGVRRTALHRAMVERADAAGAELIWETPARGLERDRVLTDRGDARARWIVGADGLHSRIRRWVGLDSGKAKFSRHGIRRHFGLAPWTDLVEVYWGDHCEAYVTPVATDEVGVVLLWSGEKSDFDRLLHRFPVLSERLEGAPSTSRDRGAGRLEQRTRAVYRERVALVGDAAGYRDAITGEGMSVAFHQARALATSILAGDLGQYARAVHRLTALPCALIRALLEVERRPWLRRRLIRALAREPALFERLLAVHTRDLPPGSLIPGGLIRLVRGLVSAKHVAHVEQL